MLFAFSSTKSLNFISSEISQHQNSLLEGMSAIRHSECEFPHNSHFPAGTELSLVHVLYDQGGSFWENDLKL